MCYIFGVPYLGDRQQQCFVCDKSTESDCNKNECRHSSETWNMLNGKGRKTKKKQSKNKEEKKGTEDWKWSRKTDRNHGCNH